jgi:spermidine synthase
VRDRLSTEDARGCATPFVAPLLASGAAALAYEVVWARDWALLCGSTATGTALVLAVYFAGLALGAALGGRVAARARDLRAWAALEAAIAGAAVGYAALRPGLAGGVVALGALLPGVPAGVRHATLAVAVLLGPATLLGATLPAATATLAGPAHRTTARLYAWNTLGGAAGALLAGFAGVRMLGVRGTLLAAAAANVLVAAAALRLRTPPDGADAWREPAIASPRAALALAAAAGAVGLADEVLWTRGLAGVLSNSTYSVTIVLVAVLLGIVAGAHAAAPSARGDAGLRTRLAVLWTTLAATTLVSRGVLAVLPGLAARLAVAFGVTTAPAGLALEALLAGVVVVVPAVALGALFPPTLALGGGQVAGRTLGRVLAANTAGGIAGALAGAFVLLPWLGLGTSLALTAGVAAVAGLACAPARRARVPAAIAVAAVAVVAATAPALRVAGLARGGRLLYYRDGSAATVSVTEEPGGAKRLRVNGRYSLGGSDGLLLERREGHLPLVLQPGATRVLLLGVGTGDTAGAVATHAGLAVDAVELVPEVLDAARLFARENGGVLDAPHVRFHADDARSFLLGTGGRWDAIVGDLFLPWTAGTAALYSEEMFALGRGRLRPGGRWYQWLPLHQLGVGDLEAIVATFTRVFPAVELWLAYHRTTTPLALLVGGDAPTAPDPARFAAALAAPAVRAAELGEPLDVGVLYVTDGARLRTATAGVAPITDDRPRLEFTAPAAYFHQEDLGRAALAWVGARLDPRPAPVPGGAADFALRATLLQAALALAGGDRRAEAEAWLAALARAPDARVAQRAVAAIARERLAAGDRGAAVALAARLGDAPEAAALRAALRR